MSLIIDNTLRSIQRPQSGVRWLILVVAATCALLAFTYHRPWPAAPVFRQDNSQSSVHSPPKLVDNAEYTTTVVAGVKRSAIGETAWLDQVAHLQRKAIYAVDDTSAPLHLDKNHGRESMVYLKYILDHFDNLTDITFFMHGADKEYHNNLLLRRSSLSTLNLAQRSYIKQQGYVNTRCDLHPGCPRFLKLDPTPGEHAEQPYRQYNDYSAQRWKELFPDAPYMPSFLAAPCCAQFAVSRETIQAVPRATFQRLADWLSRDDVFDGWSGRFMEMIWHYLFTGRSELCPAIIDCYCSLYGICNVDLVLAEEWQASQGRFLELQDRERILRAQHDSRGTSVDEDPELAAITPRLRTVEDRFHLLEQLLEHKHGI